MNDETKDQEPDRVAEAANADAPQDDVRPSAEPAASGGPVLKATFLQFLSGMAAQTLMHLGVIPNPITDKAEVDLANAKYSIDLLTILESKTQGNLNEEEAEYLKSALYDLRMRYVQAADKTKSTANTTAETNDDDA